MQDTSNLTAGPAAFGRWMRLDPEYRESRERYFSGRYSLQNFVRSNKARLIRAGALVMHAGAWYAVPEVFDRVVAEVAAERAERIAKAAAVREFA